MKNKIAKRLENVIDILTYGRRDTIVSPPIVGDAIRLIEEIIEDIEACENIK